MERNWDKIREILIATESLEPEKYLTVSDFDKEQPYEYSYHVELMEEAGLLNASISKALGPGATDFHIRRLTWSGHEFLDAIRSESIWSKTKEYIASKGGTMTY